MKTRPLSLKQAQACEYALTPRCRCRCGGAFHGAKRVVDVRTLARDDPHAPDEAQLELGRAPALEHAERP